MSAAGDTGYSISTMRFSTVPSSATRIARMRVGDNAVKLACRSTRSVRGTMTTAAQDERPERTAVARESTSSTARSGARRPASIAARSSAPASLACIMPSTNRRRPKSVGTRPAEVCGLPSRPTRSKSWSTLRIEADERPRLSARVARVFEPTGVPEAIYSSTTCRNTARARSESSDMVGPLVIAAQCRVALRPSQVIWTPVSRAGTRRGRTFSPVQEFSCDLPAARPTRCAPSK